jgi:hypothetical protein
MTSSNYTKNELVLNGRVFNYYELIKKYKLECKDEQSVFLKLLEKNGLSAIKSLNSEYSIAYKTVKSIFLLRDLFGTKPVYYKLNSELEYKDEPFKDCTELVPGVVLEYDLKTKKIKLSSRMSLEPKKSTILDVVSELVRSVSSRIYNLDRFSLYSEDGYELVSKVAKSLDCDYELIRPEYGSNPKDKIDEIAQKLIKLGVKKEFITRLVPFYSCCTQTKEKGCEIIVHSLGLGLKYDALLLIYPLLDEYYKVSKEFNLTIRYPFLDLLLVQSLMLDNSLLKRAKELLTG